MCIVCFFSHRIIYIYMDQVHEPFDHHQLQNYQGFFVLGFFSIEKKKFNQRIKWKYVERLLLCIDFRFPAPSSISHCSFKMYIDNWQSLRLDSVLAMFFRLHFILFLLLCFIYIWETIHVAMSFVIYCISLIFLFFRFFLCVSHSFPFSRHRRPPSPPPPPKMMMMTM